MSRFENLVPPSRALSSLLVLSALLLIAAAPAAARKPVGLSEARSINAGNCVKPRPAARNKRLARRSGRVGSCRRGAPAADSRASTKLYWGTWIGKQLTGEEAPWDMNAVTQFESSVGKPLSLVHFSSPFANCSSSACSYYRFP